MARKITVVNRRDIYPLPGDVYIGRPGRFGNPFVIGKDGTREEVIDKFAFYLHEHPELVERLVRLKPKRLVCFCKPEACHGDVYLDAIDAFGFSNKVAI